MMMMMMSTRRTSLSLPLTMLKSFDFSREKAEKLCLGFYYNTLNIFCNECARVVEHEKYARAYFCSRVCVCVCAFARACACACDTTRERGCLKAFSRDISSFIVNLVVPV